jgi:putative ABC transport system permease protein
VKRLFRFPWRSDVDLRLDVDDEFAFHIEQRTEALMAFGLPADEARARALREFGNLEQGVRTAVHRQQRIERRRGMAWWLDDLRQDLGHAWRSLRRTPGFTLTTILIVALSIGATTALFSVLLAVLMRPLPYPEADRLVEVWSTSRGGVTSREAVALPDFQAFRDSIKSFDALAAFSGSGFIITGDRSEFVDAINMTASMWRVLGVPPMLGRTFVEAEETWGNHRVAVISEGLWRRRFGGAQQVIGSQIRLGPQSMTIIGVMPASFGLMGYDADMWMPMTFPPGSVMNTRRNRFASVLGRLRPGVTIEQLRDDLSPLAAQLARDYPQFNAGLGVAAGTWHEGIVGALRPTLLLLFGAVVLVLLIACANLANLLIARAQVRHHELQTRVMLGATSMRLVRQVLTEIAALVAAGGAAGILVAVGLVRVLKRLGPGDIPRMDEIAIDSSVAMFAVGLTVLTVLLFGILPSRHAARAGVTTAVRAAARMAGGRLQQRSRRALIVAEVSLSLVLLIGAALLIISLQRLQQVDPGFNADRVLTAMVIRYRPDGRDAFVQQLVDRLSAVPGVQSAAATTDVPLALGGWGKYFTADDAPLPASMAEVPTVSYYHVTPEYFETMQMPVRRGRPFTAQDRADQPLVAVVNETLARRAWPNADPIGKRIFMAAPESLTPELLPLPDGSVSFPRLTVVGVVADSRDAGLDQRAFPSVFVPLAQGRRAGAGDQLQGFHYLVARTSVEPLSIASALEAAAAEIDRNAAVSQVSTLEARLSESMARRRSAMLLLGGFAALALTLAVIGLYGVMSYVTSQRRQELGVRAVVGASAGSLLRLVMTDGLRMSVVGAGIGLVLAAGLSSVMTTLLFEIEAIDVRVYAGMTALLLAVAALACTIPAVRAARTDPCSALRSE